MADEQIIYLSPEEELTSVRERLERIEARRIILVIPAQTSLRSHVSWRLLNKRARELKKDVLIISSDRQIRSVVKEAGFKVADSLEARTSGGSRPGSRPGRFGIGGKTSPHLRTTPGKASGPQGGVTQSNVRQPNKPGPQYPMQSPPQPPPSPPPQRGVPASSTFGMDNFDDANYDTGYDYPIDTPDPISPAAPSYQVEDLEDDDLPSAFLNEDIRRAKSIRDAARIDDGEEETNKFPPRVPAAEDTPQIDDFPPPSVDPDDFYSYREDVRSTPLQEQRGSVSMSELNDGVPDISDFPTEVIAPGELVDEGDLGDFVQRQGTQGPSTRPWMQPPPRSSDPGRIESPRTPGVPPRTNRSGRIVSPSSQMGEDEESDYPSIYNQSSRFSSGRMPTPGAGMSPPRSSAPLPRIVTPRTTPPASGKSTGSGTGVSSRTGPPTGKIQNPAASQKKGQKAQNRSGVAVPVIVGVLILLLIGLLAYFLPSADVTVTLPSQDYHLTMKLSASSTSQQDIAHGTLAAQTLTFTSSVQGTAQATGSTSHGTVQAQGLVYFTNKNASSIDVPNGVVLTTPSGISFMTQSDTLVPAQTTTPTPVNVIAVNPGPSGNVPTGSVTVIPGASFTAIQVANPGITIASGDLSVTNTSPITGGGTGTAPTVSKADVAKETAALDAQLQERVKTFLSKNVQTGDQQGKPIQTETPTVIPPVGAVLSATNLSFTETLMLHVTVLVVRSANLQSGSIAEVNATLSKSKELRGFAVVPQQPLQLTLFKNMPSSDGKSLALDFTASGQIAPMISVDQVRSALAGKPINQAQAFLGTPASGIPPLVSTKISVSPSFFPWMPLWKSNINVHFKTMHVTPPTKPKK